MNHAMRFASCSFGVTLLLMTAFPGSFRAAVPPPANNTIMPLHFIRGNDCTGDLIELSGYIHLVYQYQADGSIVGHFNYQQVSGVELGSGARYRASAIDQLHIGPGYPTSLTSIRGIRLIGQGGADNLLIQVVTVITINANGVLTAYVADVKAQCH